MESNSETLSAWDLQNYGGEVTGILKHEKPSCHEVEDGFCCYGFGHNSSSKNLHLASPETSSKRQADTYDVVNSLPEDNYKEEDLIRLEEGKNSSWSAETSICFAETTANLKLGTSLDSETTPSGTSSSSVSVFPLISSMPKRSKLSHPSTQTTRCQVEGCYLDLTSAKDYHRRHRICESHSKSPKVIVAGLVRRFCQQCSRFHNLSEFDDKKRSCRKRLSDHNARRRRPHPEAIPFSSTGFSSSIYGGWPQNLPTSASNTWESCSLKMTRAGNSLISPLAHIDRKQPLPLHLNSGKDESVASSRLDEAPSFPRALSLLSTSAWGLNDPKPPSLEQIMQGNISMSQPVVQLEPQNWPIISQHVSKEQAASTSAVHSMDFHSTTDSSQFQDFLSFKIPSEPNFYYSSRIN